MALYRPALIAALKGGYSRGDLLADLGAGLLVGVIALPLSMALAIASGCKPEQGLWTAIVAGILISLLGGSRVQIGGPAGAFVGLCAVGVNQFGYAGLALATLMAGALMLFFGLARLGRAISYIPTPVVIGFTTGIALILFSTQIGPALGIGDPARPAEHLHERVTHLADQVAAGAWNWRASACCVAVVALILAVRRLHPRAPGALLAIVAVSVAAHLLGWDAGDARIDTIASRFGELPSGFPALTLPGLGLGEQWAMGDVLVRLKELSSLALSIALLGSIESLLSAVVADGMSGDRHDSNTELIAQGVANLASPLVGGLPATGVIARTSTNIRAGARSPLAGIFHSLTVLAAVLAAGPLVGHVPLAALAGVLLVVCWGMAELRHWPHILKAGRGDAVLLPLAFLLTAFIGVTEAIEVCVVLAMFFFVKRMSEATEVERQAAPATDAGVLPPIAPGVEVYTIRGPFFFGASTLIRDLDGGAGREPRVMVLRLGAVPFIDATAAFSLRELHASLLARGGRLLLSDVHGRLGEDLRRHGLTDLLGADAAHADLAAALVHARRVSEGG